VYIFIYFNYILKLNILNQITILSIQHNDKGTKIKIMNTNHLCIKKITHNSFVPQYNNIFLSFKRNIILIASLILILQKL